MVTEFSEYVGVSIYHGWLYIRWNKHPLSLIYISFSGRFPLLVIILQETYRCIGLALQADLSFNVSLHRATLKNPSHWLGLLMFTRDVCSCFWWGFAIEGYFYYHFSQRLTGAAAGISFCSIDLVGWVCLSLLGFTYLYSRVVFWRWRFFWSSFTWSSYLTFSLMLYRIFGHISLALQSPHNECDDVTGEGYILQSSEHTYSRVWAGSEPKKYGTKTGIPAWWITWSRRPCLMKKQHATIVWRYEDINSIKPENQLPSLNAS